MDMSVIEYIPPRIRERLYLIRGRIDRNKRNIQNDISILSKNNKNDLYYNTNDLEKWKKAFIRLSYETNKRGFELAKLFYNEKLVIEKESFSKFENGIILVCVVKNEKDNIQQFCEYYRELGIKRFVFVDNNSDDGTREFLTTQNDVNLYLAVNSYTSIRRQAWINRIMAIYGFNRWYLVVDSDEYFDYNESETKKIDDLIEFCSKNEIKRLLSIMIDMYPLKIAFNNEVVEYLKEYAFFDQNDYFKITDRNSLLFKGYQGGLRYRLFGDSDIKGGLWLTKYPFFYFEEGDILFQSHISFPFYKNFKSDNYSVLRHYKFLPKDFQKYQERVKMGNFAGGSIEYKNYVNIMHKGHLEFFDKEQTKQFYNSDSFYIIPILKRIKWEK